jgi:hypothetical protein
MFIREIGKNSEKRGEWSGNNSIVTVMSSGSNKMRVIKILMYVD